MIRWGNRRFLDPGGSQQGETWTPNMKTVSNHSKVSTSFPGDMRGGNQTNTNTSVRKGARLGVKIVLNEEQGSHEDRLLIYTLI